MVYGNGVVLPKKQYRLPNPSLTIKDNYYAPLIIQVEELNQTNQKQLHNNIQEIYNKKNTAVFDTAATSSVGKIGDNFKLRDKKSSKTFFQVDGATMDTSTEAKLKQPVGEPAKIVDMVPEAKKSHQ